MTDTLATGPAAARSAGPTVISSADIAALAQVRRPVVSMWKKRYQHSEQPFPAVALRHNQTDYYDCTAVADWFAHSGLGNNPVAHQDALTFTDFSILTQNLVSIPMVESLLLLRSLVEEPLTTSFDQLISDADDVDPDDLFLFSEVHAFAHLPAHQDAVLALVNEIFNRSFSVPNSLDQLAERARELDMTTRGQNISAKLAEFSADLLLSLADTSSSDSNELRFVDLDSAHFGLVQHLLSNEDYLGAHPELLQNYPLVCPGASDLTARQTHRRCVAHGLDPLSHNSFEDLTPLNTASFAFISPSGSPDLSAAILEERLPDLTDASPHHVGIVVGPQNLLTGANSQADGIRSPLIRAGRLRCIILLPEGLFPNHPREQLAMWVLTTPRGHQDPTAQFYLADLTGVDFESAAADLLTDCVSAVQRSVSRGYAFLRSTSIHLAVRTPGIVFPPARSTVSRDAVEDKVLLEQVLTEFVEPFKLPQLVATPIQLRAGHRPRLTVQEAWSHQLVAVMSGNRIETDWVTPARPQDLGTRVITKDSLIRLAQSAFGDPAELASQVITPLVLGQLDQIRVTKPGDVIFVQHGKTRAAWFDSRGGNVVAHPLRVVRSRSNRVHGRVLAQDLNGFQKFPHAWRQWELRTFPDRLAADATTALKQLDAQRAQLLTQLSAIDAVEQAVTTAVSRGGVHVRLSK